MADYDHYYAVIMAGGGGTRLWPLSRQDRPKQSLPLLGEQTRDIAVELLGLDDADIDELIEAGVLEVPQSAVPAG